MRRRLVGSGAMGSPMCERIRSLHSQEGYLPTINRHYAITEARRNCRVGGSEILSNWGEASLESVSYQIAGPGGRDV